MIMPKKIYDKNPNRKKSISQLASELDESWDPIFKDPKIISLLHKLDAEFDKELEAFGDHIEILPYDEDDTFKAFKYCEYPPSLTIIGQDPYFSNIDEAMG